MKLSGRAGTEQHLWQLMDEVARAASLDEICQRALTCLHQSLGVGRASVLLFDEQTVMRFVAWTGLSEEYRKAVDGHSPWSPTDADAEPVLVPDVRLDESLSAYGDLFEREGIAALGFIPLRFADKLLGKFMLYYAEPHAFSADEIFIAQLVAGHIAFAVERGRVERDLQVSVEVAEQARAAAEASARRLEILTAASEAIARAADPDQALQEVANLAVGWLADYAVAYQLESDHTTIRRVGFAHADPSVRAAVEELASAGPPTLADSHGAGKVIATGEGLWVPDIPEELLARAVQNERHFELVRRLAPRSSIVVPLSARGRTLGALAFATTDHSGRVYTEDDFRLAQELANRMALFVDNVRLYAEARNASRARDEVLAIVSHDLRNPLNTIVTASELLETNPPPERRARANESIRRAVDQMTRLLADLLDVTQIEQGRLSLQRSEVDASLVVEELAALHGPVAESRGIRFHYAATSPAFDVFADRGRLSQALSNLLDNALKFTPDGGEVHLRVEDDGERARFWVVDSGPGVPTDQLPHLFDRFWRADRSSRDGIGLGLAIARGIAESHGGTIEVTSEAGQGAKFCIVLPRDGSDSPATG